VNPDGDLAMHAEALAKLSRQITRLFPEGSDFGETKAKESVWQDWAKFEKAADAARDATAVFAEAAASGDEARISAAHKEVGKSCKGCHEDFRQKDD
jgi:cytochrome c556